MPDPERFLPLPEVRRLVGGLSKTQIYVRMKRGRFPRPVHLGGRVAWIEREVHDWMRERVQERDLRLGGSSDAPGRPRGSPRTTRSSRSRGSRDRRSTSPWISSITCSSPSAGPIRW